jgi:hypothetical protein
MDVKVDVLKKKYVEKNWEEWPPKYTEKKGEFSFLCIFIKIIRSVMYICVLFEKNWIMLSTLLSIIELLMRENKLVCFSRMAYVMKDVEFKLW